MAGSPQALAATAAAAGVRPNPMVASPGPGNVPRPTSSPQLGSFPPTMPGYMPPASQVPGSAPRYSAPPFPPTARPMFSQRPPIAHPAPGNVPRPMGGMRPLPVLKPPGMPDLAAKGPTFGGPYEKPFTTVYVGKIATTVEDIFLRSVLQLCGSIKSWKRAQDPTTGAPKGFGFCEFETAEGVLRAMRLLNKYNLEGQELVLNVNKDTREYLERYVAAKENDKLLEEAAQEEDSETAPGVEQPSRKSSKDDRNAEGDNSKAFGIVSDEDRKGDEDALAKLKSLLEDRAKCRPLFRPLILDGRSPSTREASVRSKDGDFRDDLSGRNEDESSSERQERIETSSSDRGRRDRDHRDRENDRDVDRFERERERDRNRREKERNTKHRDTERAYEELEREWEAREREKERQRLHDREREKERERERKREVKEQEDESDDEGKKRRYRPDERRRRRQREREEDIADAIREEEEILEAKRRKVELEMENAMRVARMEAEENKDDVKMELDNEPPPANGDSEAASAEPVKNDPEIKPIPKKLGFGLSGTGKRATLPSLFHQEDEEELPKDRKLRPLVPIDYSAEEMQAVRSKRSSSPEDDRKDGRRHKDKSRKDRDKDDGGGNAKILDAKQLIDSIPKTREELFNYPVDWAIYDKHKLHEKMRPWISKKITVFLGEEEKSFVDYIVRHTCNHVSAESMLEKLKPLLDEEAEMFVLKMWRMLIFEIRRIETGLAKPNS